MSYLRSEHAPLHTLLACVLWDEKYRGRFVSFNTGKSICDVMAPDDFITGQNYLSTALKCGDDAIDWPVFGSLSPEEKTAIEYRDGVKLVIRKNLRFGKNGRASVVGCFGPDHAIPELRGSHELMAFAAGGERSSVRGEYNIPSHPTLRDSEAMTEWSDYMNCILHALNLSFQTACMDSLGDQGMNKLTVFQMLYLAILMINTIKKQTDIETLKKYYSLTMTQLLEREDCQIDASDTFVQAFEELMKEVEDVVNDDDLKEDMGIDKLLNGCPTNIKEPNFGRWGTITAVARVVKKHWLPLFYMAKNVKATEKAGCYLHTIATNLINLMNSRTDPSQETPTHYASLMWIVAFGDFMLDDHMDWFKMNDPSFGPGSYGNISRLVPVHLFLLQKQLNELKQNNYSGWRDVPEFAEFAKAEKGVLRRGEVNAGGREMFEQLPELFLQRFENTLDNHTSKWKTSKSLPMILAGDAVIAKWFLKKLFHNDISIPEDEVSLPYHYMGGSTPTVKLNECITWLVDKADLEEMLNHRIVQQIIDDLAIVADAEEVIDLLDRSTWGDHDFSKSEAVIWNEIAPRAAHQQRVENLVQTAGFLGQTHVEESRRSARAKIHCIFYRDFKIWALDSLRKEDDKKRGKQRERRRRRREEQSSPQQTQQSPAREEQQQQNQRQVKSRKQYKIQKVEGKKRLQLLSQWMEWKVEEIEKARESLGEAKIKTIVSNLSRDKKISTDENEDKIKQFLSAANSQHKRTIDSKHLADITCWMEGSLVFSYFTKTNGAWDFLLAEIKHRNIKRPNKWDRGAKNKQKKTIRIKEWTDLKEAELVILLKEHERARLLKEEDKVFSKLEEVKYIKPLSQKMKEWMPKQLEVYKKRKGL